MNRMSYKLDDAVNAACDAYDVEEWGLILAALDGQAPRNKAGKLLRDVRDRAHFASEADLQFQRGAVQAEIEIAKRKAA